MLKMHHLKWTPWLIPFLFFMLIQITALIVAPGDYRIISDQISWLGDKTSAFGWMMKSGWIGFGFLILLVVAWYKQKEDLPPSILLPMMVFGIALMLMGLWNVDRFDDVMTTYHFLAYYIAQLSVILVALLHVFLVKVETLRLPNLGFALCMLIFALLAYFIPSIAGLMERIFWLIVILWLWMLYGKMDLSMSKNE